MEITNLSRNIWEIKKQDDMNVPGRIYASNEILNKMKQDKTLNQLINVAKLPGIYNYSIVLPDGHQGYGFPIGGVAAFDYEEGIVSPGGIGFDINCGVRLIKTNLKLEDVKGKIKDLVNEIFKNVPSGLGSKGKIRLSKDNLRDVLSEGSKWAIDNGYGVKDDILNTEEKGNMKPNDPDKVSDLAYKRGLPQLGSLGAGNHFVEVEYVKEIYDEKYAKKFGLFKNQVCIMIHTGSRGLGHQVATDYLKEMLSKFSSEDQLPDKQLVYAYMNSETANDYLKAMACAANYAWTNRQLINHWVRESFIKIFGKDVNLSLLYDVTHNIAKIERYKINGENKKVIVHRKGATRSFPNQPVLIPGHMGTGSYVLVGSEKSLELSFGSTAHGAGRLLSRKEATRRYTLSEIRNMLLSKGIYLKSASKKGVVEEAPGAYKDLDEVVKVSHEVGIAKKVARLNPIGVIKG